MCPRPHAVAALMALALLSHPGAARAWGDEGHEIIGHLAERLLSPAARHAVDALLAADDTGLVSDHSLAGESTWADRYRDSDRDGERRRYRATQAWHYVDLEIDATDLEAACRGHPALPAGLPASQGPADACIVDKIVEFQGELADVSTAPAERVRALLFLLHLVGDLHQPLHASDHEDRGGNGVRVVGPGAHHGNLHHAWDTEFVRDLGGAAGAIADRLAAGITADARRRIAAGSPRDWAIESFRIARDRVYGPLRPGRGGSVELDATYAALARETVREQLEKAGIRLAKVLDDALGATGG